MSGPAVAAPERARTPDMPAGPARRWWILGVVGLAQLMVVLDATIVNIALPSAQRALGFSNADRQWVVTAYSLAFGGLRRCVGAGRRGDRFRDAGDRPRLAGGVRRDAGPGRAVHADRDVHRPGRA